jgi:hypothetical protein
MERIFLTKARLKKLFLTSHRGTLAYGNVARAINLRY